MLHAQKRRQQAGWLAKSTLSQQSSSSARLKSKQDEEPSDLASALSPKAQLALPQEAKRDTSSGARECSQFDIGKVDKRGGLSFSC